MEQEGEFWKDKCEATLRSAINGSGFRCTLPKGHDTKHVGAWCAPFVDSDGKQRLTVDVIW